MWEGDHMLWTIAVILIVLWLLGLMSGYTTCNFIHIPGYCHYHCVGQSHSGAENHLKGRIMTKREIVVFLLLATSLLSGCGTCVLIPFAGGAAAIPVAGGSYQGYTVWKGRESSKYYTYDIKTVCQAVKQSCEQLKLETVIRNPVSENGCSLKTKGNYPMEINVSNVEKNLTKVVV